MLNIQQDDIILLELEPDNKKDFEVPPCDNCGGTDFGYEDGVQICCECGNEKWEDAKPKHAVPIYNNFMTSCLPLTFKTGVRINGKKYSPVVPYHETEFKATFKKFDNICKKLNYPECVARECKELYVEVINKFRTRSKSQRLVTSIRGGYRKNLVPLVISIILPFHEIEYDLVDLIKQCDCTTKKFTQTEKKIKTTYPELYALNYADRPA
jgi:hypothetical protein